ncbi:MAG TPA: non-heme iron oxygenase ferredoxin subunit [Stellaceae bacterium]|nr:non-heme iron oxygenase ferredoxin subunit [Stellaceae bacterium]
MPNDTEAEWVTVAARGDLGQGSMRAINVGSRHIALYEVDGAIYATDNICTHARAMLTDGWLDGDVIECPLHAGRFEVKTGKGLGPPIPRDLKTYEVRLQGDEVQVKIDR